MSSDDRRGSRPGRATRSARGPAQSGSLLFAFSMACVPALIMFDFANCSTECDLLVKSLNDKRIADTSDETHVKIFKLEVMISHLNKVGSTVRPLLVARSIAGTELKKRKIIFCVCRRTKGLDFSFLAL
eukprot:SAG31_NODE_843_length_11551_cov_6.757772_6_plen_129_part_00